MSAVGWSKRADYPHINTPSQIWQSCQQGLHLEATVICIASVLLPRRPRIYLLAVVHLLSTWTRASSATHALLAGIYSRQHSQSHQLHIPSKTALHLQNPSPPHKPDPPHDPMHHDAPPPAATPPHDDKMQSPCAAVPVSRTSQVDGDMHSHAEKQVADATHVFGRVCGATTDGIRRGTRYRCAARFGLGDRFIAMLCRGAAQRLQQRTSQRRSLRCLACR